ncbi:MAG: hypothetical protein ACK4VN_00545 [Bacteroidales bacterium]
MNPWKSLTGLSSWLMRVAMMLAIFALFFNSFMNFNLSSLSFFIAAGFVVFGVLLFVGGFLSKHSLTVIAGLVIFILCGLQAYWSFNGITNAFAQYLVMGSVALFFVTNGNK